MLANIENIEILTPLLENIDATIAILDQKYRIIYTNKVHYGFKKEEIIGKSFVPFWEPPERERIMACYDRAFRGELAPPEEAMVKSPTGEISYWENHYIPVKTKDGSFYCMNISRDVTAAKDNQKNSAMVEALSNNMHDVVLLVDHNYKIKYANRIEEDWQGQQWIGKSIFQSSHPDSIARMKKALETAYKTGEPQDVEVTAINKDYNKTLSYTNRVNYIKNTEPPEYFISSINITERLNLKTTLEKQKQQLMWSSKLASLGEMSAGVAHEINNPLAVILGRISQAIRLLDKGNIEEMRPKLESIKSSSQRIAEIVQGLRNYSRDAQNDSFIRSSVKKITTDTLALCNERFKHHGVDVILDHLNGDFNVDCRPTQISQVLLNLLSNAFDAIEHHDRRWVRIQTARTKNGMAHFSVTDSGKGIPEDYKEKVMDPFFTTKPLGKGTGLGLSISAGIVKNHQGKFFINDDCANTSFVVEIPTKNPSQEKPQPVMA